MVMGMFYVVLLLSECEKCIMLVYGVLSGIDYDMYIVCLFGFVVSFG